MHNPILGIHLLCIAFSLSISIEFSNYCKNEIEVSIFQTGENIFSGRVLNNTVTEFTVKNVYSFHNEIQCVTLHEFMMRKNDARCSCSQLNIWYLHSGQKQYKQTMKIWKSTLNLLIENSWVIIIIWCIERINEKRQ